MSSRMRLDLKVTAVDILQFVKDNQIHPSPSRAIGILEQWAHATSPKASQQELLDALAEMLLSSPVLSCEAIIRYAQPIILDVCVRLVEHARQHSGAGWKDWSVVRILYVQAFLLPFCPQLYLLICDFLSPEQLSLCAPEASAYPAILVSLYRLLATSPSIREDSLIPVTITNLYSIFSDSQNYTLQCRIFALRVFAILEDLSEIAFIRLQNKYIEGPIYDDPERAFVVNLGTGSKEEIVDIWTFPITEAQRRKMAYNDTQKCMHHMVLHTLEDGPDASMTHFGGHSFYRRDPITQSNAPAFRETSNIVEATEKMADMLVSNLPVLLSGPEACGKMSLIRHACSSLSSSASSSQIVTLQLGDQSGVDAKSLIGSFVSSTKRPGTFDWVEGALTSSVRLGKWIVLKNIDKASSEVLSVFKPLVESMSNQKTVGARPSLDLGHRGKIIAGRNFAMFATRTVAPLQSDESFPGPVFLGSAHWHEVQMSALTKEDVVEVITSKNEHLALAEDGTRQRLVQTWLKLCDLSKDKRSYAPSTRHTVASGTLRTPSLHDVLKWSRRIESLIAKSGKASKVLARAPFSNQLLQEEIALEGCDIFLGAAPPPPSIADAEISALSSTEAHQGALNRFVVMLFAIADALSVDRNALWHAVRQRRPEFRVQSTDEGSKLITIGRASLVRSRMISSNMAPTSSTFALTGPASRLLERLSVCVSLVEPALIVGETGTGKTTIVQHLAALVGKPIVALNLSQQTESADLLGGFKPLDPRLPATELHNIWVDLFRRTFSARRNAGFLKAELKVLQAGKWAKLHDVWRESLTIARQKFLKHDNPEIEESTEPANKSRRLTSHGTKQLSHSEADKSNAVTLAEEWTRFESHLQQFSAQHTSSKQSLVFSFVEGPLVKAIKEGTWILLDEVNLATAETLECLSALVQSPESSLVLSERGDLEPISRHKDFRLFACMNPATDVGKKDLPNSLRSRFTELYAPGPDEDHDALVGIIEKYIGQEAVGDKTVIEDVAQCFLHIKELASEQKLADGANQKPHYSVRTLARALVFAKDTYSTYGLRRSLFEGFMMSFILLLNASSAESVKRILAANLISKAKNANSSMSFVPSRPTSTVGQHVLVGHFWLESGSEGQGEDSDYILTPSVQEKLVGLARAALTRRSPVLIQGPTSAGKTSAIEYLARRTGHKFVRINNHEHTDLQEYLGTYSTDPESGQLTFQEGLLVTAARQGHWIVLDELNLAPTDVLEALNRLLDDNRELVIPETGEVIKPHSHFMLFATQNPPGLYAGRKVLSRAFRNRFLEIHFDDVPEAELQTILAKRCRIAPSYADKIVRVFRELQRRRQTSRVFDTKQAFATLRDLFRWGMRQADNYQQLAMNGYMLIAERARRPEDALVVRQVIEETLKIKIEVNSLYDVSNKASMISLLGPQLGSGLFLSTKDTGIVWTRAMSRLVCLVASSLRYNEPILLVGETGSGKTSVCQILANAFGQKLLTVNCHQNTDASDLLGGQRPLRNRFTERASAKQTALEILFQNGIDMDGESNTDAILDALSRFAHDCDEATTLASIEAVRARIKRSMALFEWYDGPLVKAMKDGNHILLDEISLADDSVLERLNSILEPSRTLTLAEKGGAKQSEMIEIRANENFQIVATMNPGGDYGKKELSPALRNRFTEIWVPQVTKREDLIAITDSIWTEQRRVEWSAPMVDFLEFFSENLGVTIGLSSVGLRDLISWARFMDYTVREGFSINHAFAHGAMMTFVDGLPLHPLVTSKPHKQIVALIETITERIFQISNMSPVDIVKMDASARIIMSTQEIFSVGGFPQRKGSLSPSLTSSSSFDLTTRTPAMNAMRVLRALQVKDRAIMLEGSPGAGKTSLIVALAKSCCYNLTRINLSDQTELSDLFGADLPVEGGNAGEFDWRDASFLKAMKEGSWVLLDEMNLASQSVLEGLNSCLDHRGSIFIPELGRTFQKHPNFKLFAAQNPQHQGGGRKGLPKSFLNRFTKVYVEDLAAEDFVSIMTTRHPSFAPQVIRQMVDFNSRLHRLFLDSATFGKQGQPWEFNLRDLLRWLDLTHAKLGLNFEEGHDPIKYFASLYVLRFRQHQDRAQVSQVYKDAFGITPQICMRPWFFVTPQHVQIGHVLLNRASSKGVRSVEVTDRQGVSKTSLPAAQALGQCIRLAWPAILVGESGVGKTSLLRKLAHLTGSHLQEVRLNKGTDTTDIIGGFEQIDEVALLSECISQLLQEVSNIKQRYFNTNYHSAEIVTRIQHITELLSSEQSTLRSNPEHKVEVEKINSAIHEVLSCDSLQLANEDHLQNSFSALLSYSLRSDSAGKFAWRDGPVIHAMRTGQWLLLDEANLSSSSILDRLNSLLEPDGCIVLSERGIVENTDPSAAPSIETILPHKDFRIFFAMDPKYGELSRAMRNRALEIYLDGCPDSDKQYAAFSDLNFPRHELSSSSLLPWASIQDSATLADHRLACRSLNSGQKHTLGGNFVYDVNLKDALESALQNVKHTISEEMDDKLQFLHYVGPDVQTNPILFARNPNSVRSLLSRCFGVHISATSQLQQLNDIQNFTQSTFDVSGLSLLQKSAILARGDTVEGLHERDQNIFALVYRTCIVVQLVANVFAQNLAACDEVDVLQEMSILNEFLIYRWSNTFDQVDTSILIVALDHMRQMIRHLSASSEDCASALVELQSLSEGVFEHVNLTSGHAMKEMWRAYLTQRLTKREAEVLADLMRSLEEYRLLLPKDLLTNAVNITSALLAPQGLSEHQREELLALAQQTILTLQKAIGSNKGMEASQSSVDDDTILFVFALSNHYSALEGALGMEQEITIFSDYVSLSRAFPLSSSIALKALSWTQSDDLLMHRGNFDWITKYKDEPVCNTQELFRPVLLKSTCDLTSPKLRISLEDIESRKTSLRRSANIIGCIRSSNKPDRASQATAVFTSLVKRLIPHLCKVLFVEEDQDPVIQILLQKVESSTETGLPAYLQDIVDSFHSSKSLIFVAQQCLTCVSIVNTLNVSSDSGNPSKCLFEKGQSFLQLSMALLLLYVSSVPIDPLGTEQTLVDIMEFRIRYLRQERDALMRVEDLVTGNKSNLWVDVIDVSIDHLKEHFQKLEHSATTVPRGTNPIRTQKLHSEMHTFIKQIYTPSKLQQLFKGDASEPQILDLQITIASVVKRLNTLYMDLEDLFVPFTSILAMVQLGLGMLLQSIALSNRPDMSSRTEDILNALCSFPSSVSALRLQSLSVTMRAKPQSQIGSLIAPVLLSRLESFLQDIDDGMSIIDQSGVLESTYDQLWYLWTLDQEREKNRREEENSLYRIRKLDVDIQNDAELEEKEFATLFPHYDDIMDYDASHPDVTQSSNYSRNEYFSSDDILRFYKVHIALFSDSTLSQAGQDLFHDSRKNLVHKLTELKYDSLSESLDATSSSLQLQMLADSMSLFEIHQDSTHEKDFYLDGDPVDAHKLACLVISVQKQLDKLIKEWPDQQVLHHLKQRCQMVLKLDALSPVNRLLSALEGLLHHTEDWETYASSKTTLQPQRNEMTTLIIEWRRKELHGWKRLLNRERIQMADKVKDWWMTVFQAACKLSSVDEDEKKEFVSLLDQFMRGSPLGQFEERLQLLFTTASYLKLLHKVNRASDAQVQASHMLFNVACFFQQFNSAIAQDIEKKRTAIEKDILDFVKLASWKDTNVHSLKTSAMKTHRKLHQSIRKFRAVLNESADAVLADVSSQSFEKPNLDLLGPEEDFGIEDAVGMYVNSHQDWHVSPESVPHHLLHLGQTYKSLARIAQDNLRPMLSVTQTSFHLQSLTIEIYERSASLAKATPLVLTEANEKVVKSLESQKRKAWSDLIKELKRIGLSVTSVDGMSSSLMSQSSFVFSLPPMEDVPVGKVGYVNKKHFELLAKLPKLRNSIGSQTRNQDVNVGQLQSALSYIENGFLISSAQRIRLHSLHHNFYWLDTFGSRMRVLLESKGSFHTLPGTLIEVKTRIQYTSDAWMRLCSGLKEVIVKGKTFLGMSLHHGTGDPLTAISQCLADATFIFKVIRNVANAIQTLEWSVITAEESEALAHSNAAVLRMIQVLESSHKTCRALEPLCIPLLEWIRSEQSKLINIAQVSHEAENHKENVGVSSDRSISSILIIVQDLCKCSESYLAVDDQLEDRSVLQEAQHLAIIQRTLRLPEIRELVSQTISMTSTSSSGTLYILPALTRLQPFFQTYISCIRGIFRRSSTWTAALMDLLLTVCELTTSLASRGFCRPRQAEEQQAADDDDKGDLIEGGVGLGDGDGAEDVTNTLKDDEQMEELQNEGGGEQNAESKHEENAREMDNDFDGEIGDAEGEKDDKMDQEENAQQDEIEDTVGEVDPLDSAAVDEKTWAGNDEEKNDGEDKNEQQKDANATSSNQDEEQKPSQRGDDTKDNAEGAGERTDAEGRSQDKTEQNEDGNDVAEEDGSHEDDASQDSANDQGLGRAIDQEAEQGDNLELDDNINMDEDGKSGDGHGDSDLDDADAMSVEDFDGVSQAEVDENPLEADEQLPSDAVDSINDQGAPDDHDDSIIENDQEDTAEASKEGEKDASEGDDDAHDDQNDDGVQPPHSSKHSHSTETHNETDQLQTDNAGTGDENTDQSANQQQSSKSTAGRQTGATGDSDGIEETEPFEQMQQSQDEETGGSKGSVRHNEGDPDSSHQSEEEKRQSRSLGDALKQFRKNLDSIEESLSDEHDRNGEGPVDDNMGDVEHINPDDDTDMQALGAARDEDAKHSLNEVGIRDQEEERDEAPLLEIDEKEQVVEKTVQDDRTFVDDENSTIKDQNAQGGLTASDVHHDQTEAHEVHLGEDIDNDLEEESVTDLNDDLENMTTCFSSVTDEQDRAQLGQQLWKLYSTSTADHAFTLSEQLRLILAPTKATKLTGDFKTGKRLNMRKIIPFIASDYVKDKIWLRRHLPQKREYQVLVCVDDSKSMSDSHNRVLAFKSLALVCNALDRLEVGQVGVLKFGRQVELLKGFDNSGTETVGETQGARILANLPFDQRGTNVLQMMRQSFSTLVEAREARDQGGSQGQLWQLQLIISDGICQDHAALEAMLRRAAEARIMVVFIILDSLQPQNGNQNPSNSSILTMSSVEYRPGAQGRPQLTMRRYLDTFPFEYFVIVQDVADLPEVLSTTLRQWAQRIAEA